jgi:hypothetical protein
MSRFLLWLGGVDHVSLERCPSERGRIVALGGAVLTTAVLATMAGATATHTWLHSSIPVAVCGGLFWGVSIMNLDRWLLITIRRQSTPPRTLALALPRLALATIVGLVISGPLLLAIFHDEVTARALEDRQSQLAQARRKLAAEYASIQTLSREQSRLQASATASVISGVLASSTDYSSLQAQLHGEQKRLQAVQHQAICELDGTCGTDRSGAGPSYHAKAQEAAVAAAQVAATEGRLRALEGTLLSEAKASGRHAQGFARARLGVVSGELATLRREYNSSSADLVRRFGAPIGLLDRVQALGELTSEHPDMGHIAFLLTIFVLLIDGVPVCFKMLTLLGDPSLYEQIQKDGEERRFRRYAFAEDQHDIAAQIEASSIVEEAQIYAKLNGGVLDDRIRRIMDVEREATELLIPQLRKRAVSSVPSLAESYASRRERLAEAIRAEAGRRAEEWQEGRRRRAGGLVGR